jgi:hypothetical protein
MYATASAVVEHTVRECRDAITEGPEQWFPRLVSKVGDRSDKHLAAVGFKISGLPIRKHVEVTLGDPIVTGDWVTIPISWRPTFPASLFPVFDGRLKLVPHLDGHTRLTVSGTYEPPFDSLGRTLDEAGMHTAAEATLRELAESIAAAVNRKLTPA